MDTALGELRPTATSRGNRLECILRIVDTDGEFGSIDREAAMKELRQSARSLEPTVLREAEVENIEWEARPDVDRDRIILRYSGEYDKGNRSEWEEYQRWLCEAVQLYAEVFGDHLQ